MPSHQSCPHCGAKKDDKSEGELTTFACWTVFNTDEGVIFRRSFDCYERQIAQLLAANKDCVAWFEDARDEAIKLLEVLRNLVDDSQHKDHDCRDTPEHCPVLAARAIVKKYGKR